VARRAQTLIRAAYESEFNTSAEADIETPVTVGWTGHTEVSYGEGSAVMTA
jgi:hypothetical protein